MKLKLFIAIISLIFFHSANAQLLPEDSESNYLEMRYGNILENNSKLSFYSASRFLSQISADPLSNWSSPNSLISINNISFNLFPLNFKVLDLLPIDFFQSDSISAKNYFSPVNEINFLTKPIDNSFKIRGFLGSETGDPLIYTFTKNKSAEIQNKNKIAPSGVISYSNKNSLINYRLTAGYFGNFSTGSGNDETMRDYNSYFYKKQNKQILGAAELEFPFGINKKLSLYSSIITYYGWDVPPFTGTFTHFETFLHAIRLKAENIFKGFSISFIRDGSITEIHKTAAFLPAKFKLSEFSFTPNWEHKFSKTYKANIYYKIAFEKAFDLGSEIGSEYQEFFDMEHGKFNFVFGVDNELRFSKSSSGNFNIHINQQNLQANFAGEASLTKNFENNFKAGLKLSSNIRYPNLTELYGNFVFDTSYTHKSFNISGNTNIKTERTNHIGFSFEKYFMDRSLSFSANIFYEKIQNPIRQKNVSSERFNSFADIIRNAEYINEKNKKAFGGNLNLNFEPADFIKFFTNINYIENHEVKYVPKNKIFIKAEFILPFKGIFSVEYQHKSESFFDEYNVSKKNDHFLNTGFNGLIPETNIFSISFRQKFINFYFAKELLLNISIENIFDRINKYHPVGNNLNRAVIISIYTNI